MSESGTHRTLGFAIIGGAVALGLCLVMAVIVANSFLSPGQIYPQLEPSSVTTAAPTTAPPVTVEEMTPMGTTPPPTQATATPTPTPTTPAPTATATPCLPGLKFVSDVTVPDNTVFAPGTRFTKIWRVQSNGCAPWPTGSRWTFASGEQMGGPASVPAPQVAVGATTDIAVDLVAPAAAGSYKGYWRMVDPNGNPFGERAYVLIVVPTPTPTVPPVLINFAADRYTISKGQCVTISWYTQNVNGVYYQNQPVTGAESRVECPTATTVYNLAVQLNNGQWEYRSLTITVSGY